LFAEVELSSAKPRSAAASGFADFRRKVARLGSKISAPTMLTSNIKAYSRPMSAWNFMGENIQVATPAAAKTATSAGVPQELTAG
jgi:hypothetical protein